MLFFVVAVIFVVVIAIIVEISIISIRISTEDLYNYG